MQTNILPVDYTLRQLQMGLSEIDTVDMLRKLWNRFTCD